jgi:hypothetical protein
MKALHAGGAAVALFNHCRTPPCTATHNATASLTQLGLPTTASMVWSVRDGLLQQDLPSITGAAAMVAASLLPETIALFILRPQNSRSDVNIKV